MELKQDDVVMCTVKSISGTTVFLEIDDMPGMQASMVLSEVAAGRIRNLREYVSIGRKIVCKVLQVSNEHVEMSFRRVTTKEREEVVERYARERTLRNILKTSVQNYDEVLRKIKDKYDLLEFVDLVREQPKLLDEFVPKEIAIKLIEILTLKEAREKLVKKEFLLRSNSSKGVLELQEILTMPDVEIHYLGSSLFSLQTKGSDFKEASAKALAALVEIGKRAKSKGVLYEAKKEK